MFGTGLSQHARLFTLTSPRPAGLPQSLAAEQFAGREAVNALYCFDVDALSTSIDLDLSSFLGEELTLRLLQPDGSQRAWHGLCTHASWLGADGGVARYRRRLEPALALLALRRDCYIFQDKNVRDIVIELLADYPQVRFEFDTTQELAPRPVCTQYRESDLEFLVRLLASEGLNWRFEHDQAENDDGDNRQARHRLVIFDRRATVPAVTGNETLRFHGVRATEHDDAIDDFRPRRTVQANGVGISSWDPAQLVAPGAELQTNLDIGALPALPIYDGSGERIVSERQAAYRHGDLMLQALEMNYKAFEGAGAVRRLAAGHAFRLTQHDRYRTAQDRFTLLWVAHEARNNFDTGIAGATLSGIENGTYRNTFGCVRDVVPLVPASIATLRTRTAHGPQTALVVGLADGVATTNRDHQVKIQFAWQRGRNPNRGGLAHDTDAVGSAPGDDSAGTWVRVAEALAGPNWGTQFTPRIGTEVLVDFIENDIDRPVVVAQLHNGADLPPFSASVGSSANHTGVLSGIHSQNFDGSGFNQWQLDDTRGQLRTRLATSTAATQLSLGYLIQQTPGTSHRGPCRGSGFELRTDAWTVIRGGEGVLLSTCARPKLGSGVTSTQMDAAEAVSLLKGAKALSDTLSDAAAQQQALFSRESSQAQAAFIDQIDARSQGKYSGPVNGQSAVKAKNGSRELDNGQPVEKFGSGVVLMDSAAAINWATPASTVIHAGQHLHWSTQSDLHLAAAYTASTVAGNAAGFFSHSGGIQAIAANGPVSLHAHTDQLEILADKEITVISVNDGIEIKAKEKIVLQAGQSAITLEGGDITFSCPGKFTVKGGKHLFDKGARTPAELPHLPNGVTEFSNFIALHYRDAGGDPMAGVGYKIRFADGVVINGKLDQNGSARHENVPEKPVSAEYEERTPMPDEPWDPLAAMVARAKGMLSS